MGSRKKTRSQNVTFFTFYGFLPSNCLYIQASGASKAQKSQGLPIKNPYHIQGQKNECIFSPFGGYIFFLFVRETKKEEKNTWILLRFGL